MRHTRTERVPASTRTVEDHVTCDLCKQRISSLHYQRDEVTVSREVGECYPEGGTGITTKFDLCGACFEARLIPWLQSQGAEPRVEDFTY
jgi:hypothetical protein